ncbi:hypothetical protein NFJ02_34g86480 [Pycnococcus provasolii]
MSTAGSFDAGLAYTTGQDGVRTSASMSSGLKKSKGLKSALPEKHMHMAGYPPQGQRSSDLAVFASCYNNSYTYRPSTPSSSYHAALAGEQAQRAFERIDYVLGRKALPADMPRPTSAKLAGHSRPKTPKTEAVPSAPGRARRCAARKLGSAVGYRTAKAERGRRSLWGPQRQVEARDNRAEQQQQLAAKQQEFERKYAMRRDDHEARKSTSAERTQLVHDSRRTAPEGDYPVPPSSAGPQVEEQKRLLEAQKAAYRKQRTKEVAARMAQEEMSRPPSSIRPKSRTKQQRPAPPPQHQQQYSYYDGTPPHSPPPPQRQDYYYDEPTLAAPSRSPLKKALAWSEDHDDERGGYQQYKAPNMPPPTTQFVPDYDEMLTVDTPRSEHVPSRQQQDYNDGRTTPSQLVSQELNSPFQRKVYHGGTLASHIAHAENANSLATDSLLALHRLITTKLEARRGDAKVWLRAALRPPAALQREAGGTPVSRVEEALRLLNIVPSDEEMDMLVRAHQLPGSHPPLVSVASLVSAVEPHPYGGGLGVEDSYSGAKMDVLLEDDLPRIKGIFDRAAHRSEKTRRAAAPQLALNTVREAALGRRCGAAALRTLLRQLAGAGEVASAHVKALLERSAAAALHPADAEACVLPFLTKNGSYVDCRALARAVLGAEDPELPWQRAESPAPSLPPPDQAGAEMNELLPNALAAVIRERIERHRRVPHDLSSRQWAKSLLQRKEAFVSVDEIATRLRVPPLTLAVPTRSLEKMLAPYRVHHSPAKLVDVSRFVDECLFPEHGHIAFEEERRALASGSVETRKPSKRPSSANTTTSSLGASFDKMNAKHGAVAPKFKKRIPPPWGNAPKPVWRND